MNDCIANIRISLEKAHVEGIPEYIKNLQANPNSPNFKDFLLEGKAALMFAEAGCIVTIRKREEPPDLSLKFDNEEFYAEGKHFRFKEQDRIDNIKMSEPGDELVPYGDAVLLEGKPAWEQVHDVAKKKISQYKEHASNILVVESDSDCIEDVEIPSAIDMINEDIRSGKYPEFAKLNGILLITVGSYNISQKRQVYFYPTSNAAVTLSRGLFALLDRICLG